DGTRWRLAQDTRSNVVDQALKASASVRPGWNDAVEAGEAQFDQITHAARSLIDRPDESQLRREVGESGMLQGLIVADRTDDLHGPPQLGARAPSFLAGPGQEFSALFDVGERGRRAVPAIGFGRDQAQHAIARSADLNGDRARRRRCVDSAVD